MIEDVTLKDDCLTIVRDGSRMGITLTGMMTAPYRLEHWDSEKIVIIANEEYRHVLDEQGHFIKSEPY